MPGPKCRVCSATPEIQTEVVTLLLGGMTQPQVAKKFGWNAQLIRRHVLGQHPGTELLRDEEPKDADAPEVSDDASPKEALEEIAEWLRKRVNTGRARSDEIREYRITLKDLHEMQKDAEGPKRVALADVEGLPELLQVMVDALEPWPKARAAVVEAITGAGLGEVLG